MWIPRRNGNTPNRSQPYITLDGGATAKSWTQTIPPGLPENGDAGWGSNFGANRQIVCADRVFPRTFYAYSSIGGFYKYVAGQTAADGVWTKQSATVITNDEGLAKIRSVPGYGGHVFVCSGAVTKSNQPYCTFMRTTDGCKTFKNILDVQCVYAFGFGKTAPGGDYPAVYFAGLYRKQWGIYRSTSRLAAWNANTVEWTKIGDYPFGSYDFITCVEGDANIFGTVYVGFMGSGWGYYKIAS
ncbi:Glycoside Hydrolase Family 74 protein [Tuber magnatum]|uniref:Glycoside Hydrolase Family 74 protein n=1 Tax=Tuber magnatum TaxID=42249 RepID=A0A317SB85_9PEZI|nr:Glycoside Hydrolase Family 74 protein [Tuber magnatum]